MGLAIPLELRRRIVTAYTSGLTRTYEATAQMFGVGPATVSRLLRRHREKGDLAPELSRRGRKRVIDDEWLRGHATAYPDATLRERVEAWEKKSGRRVDLSTMSKAMSRIGWTHKKSRSLRTNANGPTSWRRDRNFSKSNRT